LQASLIGMPDFIGPKVIGHTRPVTQEIIFFLLVDAFAA
jgi:hypothetical protein